MSNRNSGPLEVSGIQRTLAGLNLGAAAKLETCDGLRDATEIWKETIEFGTGENKALFRNPVRVAITDSDAIEACAIPLSGLDLVAITKGLIIAIQNTVPRLLAHLDVFPRIENPTEHGDSSTNQGDRIPNVLCPGRQEFSVGMTRRALEFVLLHELAHHFYGHFHFLQEHYGSSASSSLRMGRPTTRLPGLERLAMEIQADRYAADVTSILAFQELWWDPFPLGQSMRGSLSEPLERLAIQEWSGAISVVFNLLEGVSPDSESHPHPKLRHAASVASALTTFTSTWRVDQKQERPRLHVSPNDFLALSNSIHKEVDRAWDIVEQSLPERPPPTKDQYDRLIDAAVELNYKLKTRFDKDHVI